MSRVLASAAIALLSATSATAAVVADKITKLPGWSGELPSPQYSGYLDAGECVSLSQLLPEARHILSCCGHVFECRTVHSLFHRRVTPPRTDDAVIWPRHGAIVYRAGHV
jgi:hypothetical protein